eukprot:16437139-Heterocapsa_arctica.AAC.1
MLACSSSARRMPLVPAGSPRTRGGHCPRGCRLAIHVPAISSSPGRVIHVPAISSSPGRVVQVRPIVDEIPRLLIWRA